MEPVIKIDLSERISSSQPVLIELGCGTIKTKNRINIDIVDMPGVDIIANIEEGLDFLPDSSVDEIHCRSVLEHLDNYELIMREICRVLKPDGKAYIFVPHFSNPHYYSDYTHKRTFGLYTFYYFVDKTKQLRRGVPDFYTDIRIEVLDIKLKFKSKYKIPGTKLKVSRPVKWLCETTFNLCKPFQEFYEENLCYIFPCKGIEVVFKADNTRKNNNK